MIRRGFLDSELRRDLIEWCATNFSAAHRLARRANALVLLDKGMSCQSVADVLLLDNDTIRSWYQLYREDGIEGLASFGHEGGTCRLTAQQQDKLKAWISETLPRTTRAVGAWIARECGIEYQTRSGLIALLHRLGMEHRKPSAISRKLDPVKQASFIKAHHALMNRLSADEAVIFADSGASNRRGPAGGLLGAKRGAARGGTEQWTGSPQHSWRDRPRDRTDHHEDVLTVDALSTILLLMAIEAMYPGMRWIHVFLDNARYHHAKLVQAWLGQPGRRIKLHFIPAYCPHLNPIERLWGLMHRHTTHNKCYSSFKDFSSAMLNFLHDEVPRNWLNRPRRSHRQLPYHKPNGVPDYRVSGV